jgi:Na+-driven multidrug efflux pump
MIGMTSGAVLNCIGDPILIFGFGLGVSGAGIATMVSQMVSCALLLYGCTRGGNVRIEPRQFKPSLPAYREIFRGGFPSLCRQGLGSVAAICTNQVAGGFGDAAIAAIAIVNRVTMLANSALIGFGQGFQPVCGINYGAKRYDRVSKAFWFCVRLSTIVLTGLAVAAFIFAPQIVEIFRSDDAAVVEIGTRALRLQSLVYPFLGWITICNMMLQTSGHALQASTLAIARQGIFLVGVLYLLTWRLGLLGLQMSQPIADFLTFLLAIPLSTGVLRKMNGLPVQE